jgi:hypothetical protein
VPLRIAFDLDGVLADMERELFSQAVALFGSRIAADASDPAVDAGADDAVDDPDPEADSNGGAGDVPGAPVDDAPMPLKLNMTARQQRRLWRHVATLDNFWETLQECEPGVVARLAAIALERRWEVIFLTRRPDGPGDNAQVQTQRWLSSKGFELPSVFVVQRSRGKIAASLGIDVVVDDTPGNCLDVVVDSKARAILVSRDDEKLPAPARRLGIGVVKTMGECLDILIELDSHLTEQPGVADRAMRRLGLGEPATV